MASPPTTCTAWPPTSRYRPAAVAAASWSTATTCSACPLASSTTPGGPPTSSARSLRTRSYNASASRLQSCPRILTPSVSEGTFRSEVRSRSPSWACDGLAVTMEAYHSDADPISGRGYGGALRDLRHHLGPEQLQRAHRLRMGDVAPLERADQVVDAGPEGVLLDVLQDRVRRADDAALQLERL